VLAEICVIEYSVKYIQPIIHGNDSDELFH